MYDSEMNRHIFVRVVYVEKFYDDYTVNVPLNDIMNRIKKVYICMPDSN